MAWRVAPIKKSLAPGVRRPRLRRGREVQQRRLPVPCAGPGWMGTVNAVQPRLTLAQGPPQPYETVLLQALTPITVPHLGRVGTGGVSPVRACLPGGSRSCAGQGRAAAAWRGSPRRSGRAPVSGRSGSGLSFGCRDDAKIHGSTGVSHRRVPGHLVPCNQGRPWSPPHAVRTAGGAGVSAGVARLLSAWTSCSLRLSSRFGWSETSPPPRRRSPPRSGPRSSRVLTASAVGQHHRDPGGALAAGQRTPAPVRPPCAAAAPSTNNASRHRRPPATP